jgi:hypothetical protein
MTTQIPAREMFLRPTAFEVASETRPDVTYRVQLPDCTCPDFKYRKSHKPGTFCKHITAAFTAAGWQLPGGTVRLDEATAAELLVSFGLSQRVADAALGRAQVHVQGSITLPPGQGIIVVWYDRNSDTYDVQLPG